jgi:methylmalonyl-CoA mutase
MEKHPKLFGEFPPVSTSDWESKINEDLKGADYSKLIWKTIDGLNLKPYYRAEDLEAIPFLSCLPGEFPFVRGSRTANNDWLIRQDINKKNPALANATALGAVEKGAESVGFNTSEIETKHQLATLLEGLDSTAAPLHFFSSKNYVSLFEMLQDFLPENAQGSLNFDPFGYLVLYNKFYLGLEENIAEAIALLEMGEKKQNQFRVIAVNGQHYHNAGASLVQELAFALAQGSEYIYQLSQRGIDVDRVAPKMQFTFGIGSNYFMEIARLRAARLLWAKIVEQYEPKVSNSSIMYINAVTSVWNKSIYDPFLNVLRSTTEVMSAAIGGADSIVVNPFDSTYKKPEDFSERIARNQQIISKHEAHFDKVADPSAGSYYIENLTNSIAEETMKLFLEVEEMGGFIEAVKNGFIGQEVEKTCQKRDMAIAQRRQVFVGVNQYPNLEEKMLHKIEPVAKLSSLAGLNPYRGPQAFEALRLAVENHEKKGLETPKVFLFTYGNLAMRKARAGFATNFFGVAGYQVIDNAGFATISEGVKAALESKANIIVFCSSDEEYAEMASAATDIKKKVSTTKIVVAGNPKELMEQLNAAGVDSYIHVRTNLLESLAEFNEALGIA